MNNQDVITLIPLYVANSLPTEDRKLVERALGTSKELQDELHFWQHARATSIAHERFQRASHPVAEEIVAYVEQSLKGRQSSLDIEEHLQVCRECREDTRLIREIYEPWIPEQATIPAARWNIHLESLAHSIRKWKFAVAIPALAIILLLVLLYSPSPEQLPEPPSVVEKHLPFSLAYQYTIRDPSQLTQIPVLIIEKDITHIDLRITIPKSGIDSVLYSLTIIPPKGTPTKAGDSLSAIPHDKQLDILTTSLKRELLPREATPYQILVSEILPSKYPDLTPEQYRYLFMVADSSSLSR